MAYGWRAGRWRRSMLMCMSGIRVHHFAWRGRLDNNPRAFILSKMSHIPQGENPPWEDLALAPGSLTSWSVAELGPRPSDWKYPEGENKVFITGS